MDQINWLVLSLFCLEVISRKSATWLRTPVFPTAPQQTMLPNFMPPQNKNYLSSSLPWGFHPWALASLRVSRPFPILLAIWLTDNATGFSLLLWQHFPLSTKSYFDSLLHKNLTPNLTAYHLIMWIWDSGTQIACGGGGGGGGLPTLKYGSQSWSTQRLETGDSQPERVSSEGVFTHLPGAWPGKVKGQHHCPEHLHLPSMWSDLLIAWWLKGVNWLPHSTQLLQWTR